MPDLARVSIAKRGPETLSGQSSEKQESPRFDQRAQEEHMVKRGPK